MVFSRPYTNLNNACSGVKDQSTTNQSEQQQQQQRRLFHCFWLPMHFWLPFLLLPLVFLLFTHSTTFAFTGFSRLRFNTAAPEQRKLRVMTFNIWLSGTRVENGMEKIAKHIKEVDPDILMLQEVESAEVTSNLTNLLGPSQWKCVHHLQASYPDTAIFTKHKFVPTNGGSVHLQFKRNISDYLFHEEHYQNSSEVTYGVGATIQLQPDGQLVNVFSMHLEWRSYGPYAANNKQVTNASQIMAGERNKAGYGRAQNIEELLANERFKRYMQVAEKQPLIVAGDFNCPSHLDWNEQTKDIHGGWTFAWPATKLIMDSGLNDSFRNIHDDVIKEPGTTWSTVQKATGPEWDWTIPEPQDRIDFIFYKPSPHFRPTNSYIYAGKTPLKPIPDHYHNDWPSDHYSVVTEFTIDLDEQIANKEKEEAEKVQNAVRNGSSNDVLRSQRLADDDADNNNDNSIV